MRTKPSFVRYTRTFPSIDTSKSRTPEVTVESFPFSTS
jgi:hypothetical protein